MLAPQLDAESVEEGAHGRIVPENLWYKIEVDPPCELASSVAMGIGEVDSGD